jgi:hypothetical protein
MNTFLISVDNVKERSYLDNNVDERTIKLAIMDAQEQILQPVIGSALYRKLIAGVNDLNLAVEYQNLIIQKIWPVLIHATLYKVAINLMFRYTNSSIVADGNENSTAIPINDLMVLRKEQEISMKHHLNMLRRHLISNSTTFPEYTTSEDDGINAELSQSPVDFFYDGPDIY